jgi:hypothetical protein
MNESTERFLCALNKLVEGLPVEERDRCLTRVAEVIQQRVAGTLDLDAFLAGIETALTSA